MAATKRVYGPKLLLLAALVFTAYFLPVAVSTGRDADNLDRRGAVTDARVVEVRHGRSRTIVVRYEVPGREPVTATCDSCDDRLDVGERVQIRYDPDDPTMHVEQVGRASHRSVSVFGWWAVGLIGATALGIPAWLVLRKLRRLHWC